MKNMTLSFAFVAILISLCGFRPAETSEPGNTSPAHPEFQFTANSSYLKATLQNVFTPLFDEVQKVDIHQGADTEFYYAAYGLKD